MKHLRKFLIAFCWFFTFEVVGEDLDKVWNIGLPHTTQLSKHIGAFIFAIIATIVIVMRRKEHITAK